MKYTKLNDQQIKKLHSILLDGILFAGIPAQVEQQGSRRVVHLYVGRHIVHTLPRAEVYTLVDRWDIARWNNSSLLEQSYGVVQLRYMRRYIETRV